MATLRISLFGGLRITHAGWVAQAKITRAVQGLLAYLLLNRHRIHPRETLADLFWGEHPEERARACLSTTLWRLRQVLEPEGTPKGTYLVTTGMDELGFNAASDYWLDVAVFEETIRQILAQGSHAMDVNVSCKLESALALYTGDLLDGFYDDWALRERERLRSLYLKSLGHLMQYHKHHKAYEKSLACGHEILKHDPLREEIHRDLIRLYLENGLRAMAIRQYKSCCQILREELGVPPMEETQALHQKILQGSWDQSAHSSIPKGRGIWNLYAPPPAYPTKKTTNEQAFQKLYLAMQHFEKTRVQLYQAFRHLEGIISSES